MASEKATDGELEAAVKRFQELRSKEQQVLTKINEMVSQEQEFRHVVWYLHRERACLCVVSLWALRIRGGLYDKGSRKPAYDLAVSPTAASSLKC